MAGTEILTADALDIDQVDDLEFERRTLAAIRQQLGLGGLACFLMTHRSGQGDDTRDHHQWGDGMTLEELKRELMPPAAAPPASSSSTSTPTTK